MSEKTEKHEYTESIDGYKGIMDFEWIFLFILLFMFSDWGNNTTLEKEVSELKGKVDVIERLVTK